jgi:hypothetical protein
VDLKGGRKPAVTFNDLGEGAGRYMIDHLSSQFSNSIEDFLEVPRNCLNQSPPCAMDDSESLVVADDIVMC